ncbi:MAG: hypothetical protein MI919_33080 [Holophagales bacterium]|nr:hypothetical protein [Holophagales bacterium]
MIDPALVPSPTPRQAFSRKRLAVFLALVLVILAVPIRAQVRIETDPPIATAGEPITIRAFDGAIPLAGAQVEAETRPASQIAHVHTVGHLSRLGELRFEPGHAGLLRLRVLDPASGRELGRQDLAVRYPGVPPAAAAVLIGAGALLFGGVWIGMRRQLRGG